MYVVMAEKIKYCNYTRRCCCASLRSVGPWESDHAREGSHRKPPTGILISRVKSLCLAGYIKQTRTSPRLTAAHPPSITRIPSSTGKNNGKCQSRRSANRTRHLKRLISFELT